MTRHPLSLLGALLLFGCHGGDIGTRSDEESAQQIANRAHEISAAADLAINQQIAEMNATAETGASEPPSGTSQN